MDWALLHGMDWVLLHGMDWALLAVYIHVVLSLQSTGVSIQVAGETLPNSTERAVTISGQQLHTHTHTHFASSCTRISHEHVD